MKPSIYRRIRRRSASYDAATPKKDNQQEQSFFGETIHEPFFQPAPVIQRKCADCDKEEKKMQRKEDKKEEEKKLMKKEDKKEEEKLQKKEAAASSTGAVNISSYVSSLNGKGNPLPAKTNQFFSARMGYDFGDVKVHTDKEAAASAKAVNAKAYTIGNNIVFNEGQYNKESGEGKKLLAHELVHVLQSQGHNNMKLQKKDAAEGPVAEEEITDVHFEGEGSFTKDTIHEGNCQGVRVSGKTRSNYSNSFSSDGTREQGRSCRGCPPAQCITSTGTVTSEFSANPAVSLPSPPARLNECETTAVQNFIDTTLSQHEQQHVDAFNTYAGTVVTDYTYNGCASGLRAHIRDVHNRIEVARRRSSDSASAALDANGANQFTISCDCPEPAAGTD